MLHTLPCFEASLLRLRPGHTHGRELSSNFARDV